MLVGNTFEVGDFEKVLEKTEIEDLTNSICKGEKIIPSKEHILEWLNSKNIVDSKEISEIMNILKETENNVVSFYTDNDQYESLNDLVLLLQVFYYYTIIKNCKNILNLLFFKFFQSLDSESESSTDVSTSHCKPSVSTAIFFFFSSFSNLELILFI